jgi:ankyrin repeat protein
MFSSQSLILAIVDENITIINRILNNQLSDEFLNQQDSQGETALSHACFGMNDVACKLIDMNANVDHKNNEGITILARACSFCNIEVVDKIISRHNFSQKEKKSAIISACMYGNSEVVNYLFMKPDFNLPSIRDKIVKILTKNNMQEQLTILRYMY